MKTGALKIQRNWRSFQARLHVKVILYDRLDTLYKRRLAFITHKKEESGALLIQRNWRRHHDLQKTVRMRRDKADAERLVSSMLVALYTGASELRHHVHPYWRHLPVDIQEVLSQIKASLQRTIGLVPITGKLANEELGQRSLRVGRADDTGCDRTSDLASHMLISVSRHMLAHLPAEIFSSALEWACYGIAHQAVAVAAQACQFQREIVPIGKELPPHPVDKLNTLYEDTATIRHPYDWLIGLPDESLPMLMLSGLPNHHRHVYITAQVLITMRQALEQPSLSTEDHLKFHGLDGNSGAQMMEVLSSELDQRLPSDWPKNCATVTALAGQMNSHIATLSTAHSGKTEKGSPEKGSDKASDRGSVTSGRADSISQTPGPSPTKAKSRPSQKAAEKVRSSKKSRVTEDKVVEQLRASLPNLPEVTACSQFNRRATLRVLQQVAFFMGMHKQASGTGAVGPSAALQQNRYLSVTDKLFEMADRAPHDHCSFALAVVLYHMVLRALMLRVVYHRAAVAVQNKFRYKRGKGQKQTAIAPAILIQRRWRGVRAALFVMRQDDAAEQIQRNFRAWRWNRRTHQLLNCTLKIQRVWHSAIHRRWLRHCHAEAKTIQRFVRGMLVRRSLDAAGRDLVRQHQVAINEVLRQRNEITETELLARTAALAARARVALHLHRERNVDLHRMAAFAVKAQHTRNLDKRRQLALKGAVQPARLSIFEPMIFAMARLEPRMNASYGVQQSRVLMQVVETRKSLERSLPPERRLVRIAASHVAAKRGRAAIAARRQAKKPVSMTPKQQDDTDTDQAHLRLWMCKHLGGTR